MSTIPKPPGRFQPQLGEMSAVSSKKVRRIAQDPVQTTFRSSRDTAKQSSDGRIMPLKNGKQEEMGLGKSTTKSRQAGEALSPQKRLIPNPVVISPRTRGKSFLELEAEEEVQEVYQEDNNEESGRQEAVPLLSHEIEVEDFETSQDPARRKSALQPIETEQRSRKSFLEQEAEEEEEEQEDLDADEEGDNGVPLLPHERNNEALDTSKTPARRKFVPQLIETAKRIRKIGDTAPTVLPGDKTNICPGDNPYVHLSRKYSIDPQPPTNSPSANSIHLPQWKPHPYRQGSIRPHYNTRVNTRQHSFKVPQLDAIEGSGSEKSSTPSLSRSQSNGSELSNGLYKDATHLRESVDGRFSGYLLALAAKAAEKQLREQAAAAFLNSDDHEGVAHYMDRKSSDSSEDENVSGGPDPTRRDSADDRWALQEMQRHGELIKQQRKKTAAFNVEFDIEPSKDAWITPSAMGGAFTTSSNGGGSRQLIGGYQRDPGLKQMRKAASPPMLGGDIDFPRCPSPVHARFDVTQGSDFLRNNMCYLTEQTGGDADGLWRQNLTQQRPSDKSTQPRGAAMWGVSGAPAASGAGLWGGFCTGSNAKVISQPTGLVTPIRTPKLEKEDPVAAKFTVGMSVVGPRQPQPNNRAPPSPPSTSSETSALSVAAADEVLEVEAKVEEEFDDGFVTQVYNYLSLGYPSLARKFDEELSRISNVPIEELRQDDDVAEARGYVKYGEEELDGMEGMMGMEGGMCARWRALRGYVREWGRQSFVRGIGGKIDGSEVAGPARAWGLPARRGSWGI